MRGARGSPLRAPANVVDARNMTGELHRGTRCETLSCTTRTRIHHVTPLVDEDHPRVGVAASDLPAVICEEPRRPEIWYVPRRPPRVTKVACHLVAPASADL